MAEIIYLDSRRPFDIKEEPCANCPPKKKEKCAVTCDKANRWFNRLAELIGHKR